MGVLRALLDEEQALKEKLKERRQSAVASGLERRSLIESGKAKRDGRRASAPDATTSGLLGSRIMRPTAASQQRKGTVGERRRTTGDIVFGKTGEAYVKEERPEEPEETEEQRQKWEKFHYKNSVFRQEREKHLDNMRQKRKEEEMEGCTFEPQKSSSCKSSARTGGPSSMFERARQMEVRKQERMNKIRQELFDKEMAQCSFHPTIVGDMPEYPEIVGDPALCVGSCGGRPPLPSGHAKLEAGYPKPDGRRYNSLMCGRRSSLRSVEETSECSSEYWEGNADGQDEASSLASHEENDEEQRLKVMQRLAERRRLLEETLSPDPTSCQTPAFDFGEAALRGASPSVAVAAAVERMEGLLLGDCGEGSDSEDSSGEWQDEADDDEEEVAELDGLGISVEALAIGGKHQKELRSPCVSPSRGGG